MAANIGTITQGDYTGPGSGTTVTITNVTQDTGSNRYLYFIIQHVNFVTPSNVTYNGDSMTKFRTFTGQSVFWEVYELANPDTGDNNIVITYPAFQEYGTDIGYMAISTTDADGYGGIVDESGSALNPNGLDFNLTLQGTGSAIIATTAIPTPTSNGQTLEIDGSTKSSAFPYFQQVGTSNTGAGWFKENVSTGNCNVTSTSGFNMAALAFEVKGAASATPTLSRSTSSLSGFTYGFGSGPSSQQSFTVSGNDLTANVTVTAPTNYEVSTTSGSGFGSSVVLTQSGGDIVGEPKTVYVRLKSGLSVNTYNGNVTISSTGATSLTVALSGSVTAVLLPTVTMNSISPGGATLVVANGEVTSDGGAFVSARGFVWNTTGSPDMNDNIVADFGGTGTGTYSENITLVPGLKAYIEAYATNSVGTAVSTTGANVTLPGTRRVFII
jgi:hypothetical protein